MNNRPAFRKGLPAFPVAFFLFLAAASAAFALPRPDATLGASGGFISGESLETVYSQNRLISELVWPLDPIAVLGLDTRLVWKNAFGLVASATFGIPGGAGTLTDSDFLNVTENGSTARTHYSEHDSRLDHYASIDLAASWKITLPSHGLASRKPITITPSAGIRYSSIKWTGSNGYYQYGTRTGDLYTEWSESMPKTSLSGKVIEYRQTYFAPIAGVSINVPVGPSFDFEASFTGSPAVWCNDLDEHLLTGTDYYDYVSGGYLLEPKARVSWAPTDTISLFTVGSLTRMLGLRGTTDAVDVSTGATTSYSKENGSGVEYSSWSIRLGIQKTFR